MTINNLGQINTALGGSAVDSQVAVVFVGLFNGLGRIVIGNIQDRSGGCGITRPVLSAFAIILMGVGQLVLAEAINSIDLLVGVDEGEDAPLLVMFGGPARAKKRRRRCVALYGMVG